MGRLQEIELRVTLFSFRKTLQELLPVSGNELSSEFDYVHVDVGQHRVTDVELLSWGRLQLCFIDAFEYHQSQLFLELVLLRSRFLNHLCVFLLRRLLIQHVRVLLLDFRLLFLVHHA